MIIISVNRFFWNEAILQTFMEMMNCWNIDLYRATTMSKLLISSIVHVTMAQVAHTKILGMNSLWRM